jgi:copper homeostasis protein
MKKAYKIEICASNIQSALAAGEGGADRIELVDNLFEGGTTPSFATIKTVMEKLRIGVMVMIRPRGGDFCYSDLEFGIMKQDIEVCKDLGVNGVVFGILHRDGTVDVKRTRELVDLARPMEVTFHRAFDVTPDPFMALESIIDSGVHRMLTAGQKNTVPEGLGLIREVVDRAGDRIVIMPGSGIRESNIRSIRDTTGAREFHLTAREPVESVMTYRRDDVFMGGLPEIPEYKIFVSNAERIRKIVTLVNNP